MKRYLIDEKSYKKKLIGMNSITKNLENTGQVLAHAFYPGTGKNGDAHFDEDENWAIGVDSKKGYEI